MSGPSAGPRVRLRDVAKRFGDVSALEDVTLDIDDGEFVTLLGPSGCGKTTLLRIVAGFERPSAGQVLLGGHDVTKVPPHRRPVNMVFQRPTLFPHLDVAANVAFGPRINGYKGNMDELVERSLRRAALWKPDPGPRLSAGPSASGPSCARSRRSRTGP